MNNVAEIGSITMFINVPHEMSISDEEEAFLANEVADRFQARLRESEFGSEISVVSIDWRRGCIVEILTLGVVLAAAGKFIKDYSKYRKGLIQIAKDLNGLVLILKRGSKHSVWFYTDDLTPEPRVSKTKATAELSQTTPESKGLTRRSIRTVRKQ